MLLVGIVAIALLLVLLMRWLRRLLPLPRLLLLRLLRMLAICARRCSSLSRWPRADVEGLEVLRLLLSSVGRGIGRGLAGAI